MNKKIPKVKEYGNYLYVRYRDFGKLVQVNFGRADSPTARRMAQEYVDNLITNRHTKLNRTDLALFDAIEMYLEVKKPSVSIVYFLGGVITRLKTFFTNETLLSEINQKDINKFTRKMLEDIAPSTARVYVRCGSMLFNFFFQRKWVSENYFKITGLADDLADQIRNYEYTLKSIYGARATNSEVTHKKTKMVKVKSGTQLSQKSKK